MTTTTTQAHPEIVSRDTWLAARRELLAREKDLTHARDALSAQRRRMPMVRVDKPYQFDGPRGKASLLDLFDGRRQLIVYHFMFEPGDPPPGKSGAPFSEGCPGCSHVADNLPHLAHLHARDTSLVMVSRAPLTKIAPFQARMGWTVPWYSSFGSDFNHDFYVTVDPAAAEALWNYRSAAPAASNGQTPPAAAEMPGLSVFLRVGDAVCHTYSTYQRGLDPLLASYQYLDLTPLGRQEDWEDSPPGWPQSGAGHSWLRHHDRYDGFRKIAASCCNAAKDHA